MCQLIVAIHPVTVFVFCSVLFFPPSMVYGLMTKVKTILRFTLQESLIYDYNPELYLESLGNEPWEQYIQEGSKQDTSCDNLIISEQMHLAVQFRLLILIQMTLMQSSSHLLVQSATKELFILVV